MIQPFPKVISFVGYGDAHQEVGILDGNTSGVLPGKYAPMAFAGDVRSLTIYRALGLPEVKVGVYINNVSTGLEVTLPSGATQAFIQGHGVYGPGDLVTYKIATTLQFFPGFDMGMCVELEPIANHALCFTVTATSGGGAFLANHYAGALGNGFWAENRSSQSINALTGSVTRLALRRFTHNTGGSWRAWIEVGPAGTTPVLQDGTGGTIDTLVELLDTDGADVAIRDFILPCVPTEYVNVVLLRVGSEPTFAVEQIGVGVGFVPDTPGQFMLVGGSNDTIWTDNLTSWKWNHSRQLGDVIEKHTAPVGRRRMSVSAMYVEHTSFPGVGKTFTDTLLKNGAPTNIAVVVSGPATRFGQDVGKAAYGPKDLITIELTRTSGSDTGAFYWAIGMEVSELPRGNIGPIAWLDSTRVQP